MTPPEIQQYPKIILFDGVCVLCTGWSKFVLKRDVQKQFVMATVQSPVGQRLLSWLEMPLDEFETMIYLEKGQCYTHLEAFLKIIQSFAWPWRILLVLKLIPRRYRDKLYCFVASRRYRWFGKRQRCFIPSVEQRAQILQD
ncbi:thiol-disulfide oxidoreductase DCC family protein [Spartinivicinus poritis]|uniref:DCC1-like thiol-disulfide oxidoreductase family protein n=1 Tax=Spartinivicinus poritis TaxID=2994640 RepID=A0ABT5UGE4_9GAMM|nr:DCC1-like thiol-disulfide oxidoreductase family protein [Spartinivicinus sp. A2-2]MDE1464503.1 DCC1-like thiol-disulfide oxidoreductase family protein [Spartinivicinus sp. A2-2]